MPEYTVIIVCRNEARHIRQCLESVCAQFTDPVSFELLLIDGLSEDDTVRIAGEFLDACTVSWKLILNTHRLLASGWNLGIRHARGRYIIRPDAHATLEPGYIARARELLDAMPEVAAAGGMLLTKADTLPGKIIREALSMRTGVGNSSFRTGAKAGYQDTVVYGLYRKEVFERCGVFNEHLVRHQDTEMHHRMRQAGYRFYMDPGIRASYYCRDSLKGILSQMHDIGYYFSYLVREGAMGSLQLRHKVPFLFYATLLFLLILSAFIPFLFTLFIVVVIVYLGTIAAEGLFRAFRTGNMLTLPAIALIPIIHASYAWGTFRGWLWLTFSPRNQKP
jgi:glycosyltransferase involved in cell wall biosynthesis